MKIRPVSSYIQLSKIRNAPPVFRAQINNCSDTFEKSKVNPVLKTFELKNTQGEEIECEIILLRAEEDIQQCRLYIDNNMAGEMVVCNDKENNCLHIEYLDTRWKGHDSYKGAGSELIKYAVQESIRRGYEGRIGLTACNINPPFIFYYKNNFLPDNYGKGNKNLAAIHYGAKNNINISRILPPYLTSLDMSLSKEGAEALLRGERLFLEQDYKTIREIKVKQKLISFDCMQTQKREKEFTIQAIDKNTQLYRQLSSTKCEIKTDEKGARYIELSDFYSVGNKEKGLKRATIKSAKILAKQLGIKKVKTSKDF